MFSYKRVVNIASYDNCMLINSYFAFGFWVFALYYDNLIAISCRHILAPMQLVLSCVASYTYLAALP